MSRRSLPTPDQVVQAFERAADRTRAKSGRAEIVAAVGVGLALALAWLLAYSTNGASSSLMPVAYLPIIAAGLTLGAFGGFLAAIAGATLMGPLMPLDVSLGLPQPVDAALYRTGFFVVMGLTTAAFAAGSRERYALLQDSQQRLSDLSARNLRLFARLVSERDELTAGHCERVANNAVILGRALGITGSDLKTYYWAGLLHDLGKLGVPEAVLQKTSRLDADELKSIKIHPIFGEEILLAISDSFRDIARGVRSHHERWDGTGYPDGLEGEEIPLVGRILAVVDVYEAVTSFRPYRGPMGADEAREVIRELSGTYFDPRIAETFLALEASGQITREAEPVPMYDVFGTDVIEGAARERVA
jgi:hypothetical protein